MWIRKEVQKMLFPSSVLILQTYLTPEEIEEIRAILKDAQGADPDKVKRIKNIRFKLKKLIR